jgi:hypothetical protein
MTCIVIFDPCCHTWSVLSYLIRVVIFDPCCHIWSVLSYLIRVVILDPCCHIWSVLSYLIRVVIFDPCRHTLFVSSYLTCVIILFCANLVNLSPCEAEKVYPNTKHCIVVWSSSVLFLCMQYCLILYIKKNVLY